MQVVMHICMTYVRIYLMAQHDVRNRVWYWHPSMPGSGRESGESGRECGGSAAGERWECDGNNSCATHKIYINVRGVLSVCKTTPSLYSA